MNAPVTAPIAPPSPYSSALGKSNSESHTLSVLVDNEPGVLARVVGLFSGRGYNIESLTVAEVAHAEQVSRITMERELAMVKVRGKGENRADALRLADAFRARVIDASVESFIFELTGAPKKIDDFIEIMRPIGLVEVSRTGVAAITRGPDAM
jgi:acetolactate synthase-1/3 small subunit